MIQNVWAVGRNYAEHAKELGNEVPTEPLIFLKAGSTTTQGQNEIHYPEWATDVHHEVELALCFNNNLQVDRACIALDLTERAKQNQLKAKGHPWTLAKSFKESCPLSDFFPIQDLKELKNLNIRLSVNGELRQNGNTNQFIFTLETLIKFVLDHFPVMPGDLLLTGTPAGVGPIKPDDKIDAEIVGKIRHHWVVKKALTK